MASSRVRLRYTQLRGRRQRRAKAIKAMASGAVAQSAMPRTAPANRPGLAWRLVPLRGRFLAPFTKLVLVALPDAPATFSAVDVAEACQEAEKVIGRNPPCNPAEIIDLLVSRGIVEWSSEGFRKKQKRMRPRA